MSRWTGHTYCCCASSVVGRLAAAAAGACRAASSHPLALMRVVACLRTRPSGSAVRDDPYVLVLVAFGPSARGDVAAETAAGGVAGPAAVETDSVAPSPSAAVVVRTPVASAPAWLDLAADPFGSAEQAASGTWQLAAEHCTGMGSWWADVETVG